MTQYESLLNKYIETKDPLRLDVFVTTLNPNFTLNKTKRSALNLLIQDYVEAKQNITKFKDEVDKENIPNHEKLSKIMLKTDDLKAIFGNILSFCNVNPENLNKDKDKSIFEFTQIIDEKLAKEAPLEVYDAIDRYVDQVFGDPADVNSKAFSILNYKEQQFWMRTSYDPSDLIERLFRKNFKEYKNQYKAYYNYQNEAWNVTTKYIKSYRIEEDWTV